MLANLDLDEALRDARSTYTAARPRSLAAHEAACAHLPGGNTRTVLFHGPFPLRAERGEGPWLHDVDGHRYLNLLGEYTAGLFGHSHPSIRRAVDAALDGGVNLGAHNRQEARLAELVCGRFPAIERVRFTNSGTEANLMAVSTARAAVGRSKVLVCKGGYHGGLMYFANAAGGIPINAPFDFVMGTYNDVEATRAVIREHADELACVLVEPMIGSGGCLPGETAFLWMLREETRDAGALLILDEVMTSRFGRGGAHAMHGLTPDLVALGKWIGGGMSFGAFGGRPDLMAMYDPTAPHSLPHAGTFNNNVLSMYAGIAALSEVFTPDVAETLHARGEALRAELNGVLETAGVSMRFSGCGSLMNLHALAQVPTRVAELEHSDDRYKELVFLDLLERGYYLARRGFIALSLVVEPAHLDAFVATFTDVVAVRKAVLPSDR